MDLSINSIDKGNGFDFGKTSNDYAKYRDIYPKSMYEKLIALGIGKPEQKILDIGTGTGVIPRNMQDCGAKFTGIDISENQINKAKELSEGMDIDYLVASADRTGFSDHCFDAVTACQCFQYFDTDVVIPEIARILKLHGFLCKIFMVNLPHEDEIIAETEELVAKYNPKWNGKGYGRFKYDFPKWAEGAFDLETYHSYDEVLEFSVDAWCGRMRTCRAIGASLPETQIVEFDNEYRQLLSKYTKNGLLHINHQINIQVFKLLSDIEE